MEGCDLPGLMVKPSSSTSSSPLSRAAAKACNQPINKLTIDVMVKTRKKQEYLDAFSSVTSGKTFQNSEMSKSEPLKACSNLWV